MVMGPQVRSNRTPMEGAFACMADKLADAHKPRITIAVGDVKDYTGAYNINEGNAMSQGGALMVYRRSASSAKRSRSPNASIPVLPKWSWVTPTIGNSATGGSMRWIRRGRT